MDDQQNKTDQLGNQGPASLPFPEHNPVQAESEAAPVSVDEQGAKPYQPLESYDTTTAARHEQSIRLYPDLDLGPNEYVIEIVRRSSVGLIGIWFFIILMIVGVLSLLPLYAINRATLISLTGLPLPSAALLSIPLLLFGVLIILGGLIATHVYESNNFYLTNVSIIQHAKVNLFNSRLRLIGLVNVDDASAEKNGLTQQLFNFGTVHITCQGETTRFTYIKNPQKIADDINNAVEQARRDLEHEH